MLGVWNVIMKFVSKEENSESNEDKIEYEMMVTRSGLLYLNQVEEDPPTSKQNRKSSRRNHFILCKTHYSKANIWTSECNNCKDCVDFPVTHELPNGKLPTLQQTIAYFLTCQDNDMCHEKNVTRNSCLDVMLHWVYCNVYTVTYKTVKKKLEDHLQTYHTLRKYDHNKRKVKYWEKVETFSGECKSIFDIRADSSRTTSKEKLWELK